MMPRCTLVITTAILLAAAPLFADEPAPEAQGPWQGSLGFSFVANTGNSSTQSLGLDFQITRKPEPWGLDAGATYTRAEEDGATTAERYGAHARAERAFSPRWSAFGGLRAERDTFSGYDLRAMVETGATYTALTGPVHQLAFDGGLTWTREELVDDPTNDYAGGILGARYTWQLSETAAFGQHITWYPNFQDATDWRLTSETALRASINASLALKMSYEVRYDHLPVPGYTSTDTTTKASLVVSF